MTIVVHPVSGGGRIKEQQGRLDKQYPTQCSNQTCPTRAIVGPPVRWLHTLVGFKPGSGRQARIVARLLPATIAAASGDGLQ
jgi:hypothetical protein